MYAMPEDNPALKASMPEAPEGLPELKPEDMQYFGKLLQQVRRRGARHLFDLRLFGDQRAHCWYDAVCCWKLLRQ